MEIAVHSLEPHGDGVDRVMAQAWVIERLGQQ